MSFTLEPRYRTGSGDPLVLLHGFTGTWRIWLPVIPELSRRFDVFAPTLGGHCGADPWQDGVAPTVAALADVAERQLDEAGIDTAHIAGNSLGGWLALELAKRGRARSVVAVAPAGGWTTGDEGEQKRLTGYFLRTRRAISLAYPHARRLVTRPGLRKLMFRDVMVRGDRLPPGEAAQMMQSFLECSIFSEFLDAVMRDGPAVDLDQVSCPVRIAWCEKDTIFPVERYADSFNAVPGVDVVRLPNCGHVPMYDDPDLIARTIGEFAATVDVSESDSHSASASSVH